MKTIRAKMDPKALLDELMGKDRDLPFDQQKKKRLRFDDPEVFSLCKVSMLYACSLFRSPWCVVSAALNTFYFIPVTYILWTKHSHLFCFNFLYRYRVFSSVYFS